MEEISDDETEQTGKQRLVLAALTIKVLVYALLPFSRGTRWLGQTDIVLAISDALKETADEESSS